MICVTIDGFGFLNGFIDHLQVVTTNNSNSIAISTLYSSQEHTVQCSQSVTRRFLVTAATVATSLPPASNPFFTDFHIELTKI
jgi:hypothetical protein